MSQRGPRPATASRETVEVDLDAISFTIDHALVREHRTPAVWHDGRMRGVPEVPAPAHGE